MDEFAADKEAAIYIMIN
jgi:hypothetical protein